MKFIKHPYPFHLKKLNYNEAFLRKNHDRECNMYQDMWHYFLSEFLPKMQSQRSAASSEMTTKLDSFLRTKTSSLGVTLMALMFFIFLSKVSFAQELQGKFQDWNVFKTERGDKTICYLASTPIKRDGNYEKRGESFFLVTNIENDADEVSASSGFIYNKSSNVEVSFGSKKFYLFPYKSMAWANDKNDDIDVIKEMQKHDDMIVSGVGREGKIATDTYSLIGFVQGYAKMKQICKDAQ